MAEIDNITQIKQEITDKTYEIINQSFSSLFSKIKPILYIILALIIIYIIYQLIKFFLRRVKKRRIKLTYLNTEKIIEKLDSLEEKIDSIIKQEEIRKTERKIKKSEKEIRRLKKKE